MRKVNPNAKPLREAKLADLKENAKIILANHRRTLLNEYPFIGAVAMNLEIVPVRDFRVPTACTDGKKIFFDIDFLSSLSPEHQLFVLGHEIWHTCLAHFLRTEGRDPKLFNIAEDYEVNQLLASDGFNVPPSACMPKNQGFPGGLSAEQYYNLLIERQISQKSSDSDGEDEDGSDETDADSNDSFSNSGNSDGKIESQFDKHITDKDNVYTLSNPDDIADKYGKVGEDSDFKPEAAEAQASKIREVCVAAAQIAEKSAKYRGNLPDYLKKFVTELMTPEIPWQDTLASFVTRSVGSESSWNRPNRRLVSSGVYLPSRSGESINVGVIIDTSASTEHFLPKFFGELNSIVKSFDYTLTVLQCDTEVKSVKHYNEEEPLDLESEKFEVSGFGGTKIYPAFQHILDNEDECQCDVIVCFTDGETEEFTRDMDPGIPTLFILTNEHTKDNFKFGEVCVFKDYGQKSC